MSNYRSIRRGAATVEFAIVAPIFFFVILIPMIEFGRAMVVASAVASAAEVGCRQAVLADIGNSNSKITTAVTNNIRDVLGTQITPGVTVQVNGAQADISTAVSGSSVSVTVSVPYDNVSWLPISYSRYVGGLTIRSTQVMRHE